MDLNIELYDVIPKSNGLRYKGVNNFKGHIQMIYLMLKILRLLLFYQRGSIGTDHVFFVSELL